MAQTSSSDSLVRRARSGDEAAFRALYEQSVHDLKARIRRQIGPALRRKVDASDILQDAYMVALRRLDEFTGESSDAFGAWLATIVECPSQAAATWAGYSLANSVAREARRL